MDDGMEIVLASQPDDPASDFEDGGVMQSQKEFFGWKPVTAKWRQQGQTGKCDEGVDEKA